jgi:hypothetical protein
MSVGLSCEAENQLARGHGRNIAWLKCEPSCIVEGTRCLIASGCLSEGYVASFRPVARPSITSILGADWPPTVKVVGLPVHDHPRSQLTKS